MKYWQCKCGYKQYWESGMIPPPCIVCDKCGSTLAQNPNAHRDPEPHELKIQYNEDTGKPDHQLCTRCFKRFPLNS